MDHESRIIDREAPIIKDATDARQGTNRAPLLYILIGGMALATVAFALMFLVH